MRVSVSVELCMEPTVRKAISGTVGGPRIDLLVGIDDGLAALRFADTVAQVGDQLLQSSHLGLRRKIPVEIPHKADSEGNVVEVVAGDMPSIELRRPAMPDFDLSIPGAVPVADHEVVGKTIHHMPHTQMVDVKDSGVSLPSAAVVDDDILPPTPAHWRMINGGPC